MFQLKEKVVVITGASSGIGEAIALEAAKQEAKVVIAARRIEKLQDLASVIEQETGQKALVVETDVTVKSSVENLIEKSKAEFGKVDVLINNAGVMLLSFLKNDQVDQWERMVDVNIKGVLFGIHAVLPSMVAQGHGQIINVSSVAGHEVFPSSTVYSATKYAVRALSIGMEKELAKAGIRVTNISPGAVSTELAHHITDPDVLNMFQNRAEGMQTLEAKDIAEAVVYAMTQPDHVNVNEVIVRPMQTKNQK
ncbi:SDR family oxidoreductase [Bacillus sp. V5-8f]|uniref:SDR family oxidoreductase n=1 Tax=Bacillus sp. V5-8f TaxID=2053044 RepID=UPI000C7745D5|nr:SDR family oxidoreductase [Bacillus sp. V5-8f]PLT35402.1 oxidoreductase [Bacillus sp. V5-8f]